MDNRVLYFDTWGQRQFPIRIYDEGAYQGHASALDFVGPGVTAIVNATRKATITIPGAGIGDPVNTPPSLATGLISYWKLDEASGDAVDSHGTNTLTDTNTVTAAAGKINGARQFTSPNSEHFTGADNVSYNAITTKMSVQIWAYDDGGGIAQACMISKGAFGGPNWSWALQKSPAGGIRFFLTNAAGDPGNNWADFNGIILSASTFYHILVVVDTTLAEPDRVKLYINGSLQGVTTKTGTWNTSITNDGGPLIIGDFNGLSRYWNGRLDEAALWSIALTGANATSLYNAGSGLPYGSFGIIATNRVLFIDSMGNLMVDDSLQFNSATDVLLASKIGVGILAPIATLHVFGGGWSQLTLESSNSSGGFTLKDVSGQLIEFQNTGASGLIVYDRTAGAYLLALQLDGKLGLGLNNTNPAEALDVDGNAIISGSLTLPNTGLHILDTNASHDLIIAPGSNITADRTLSLVTGDANRTITLTGNPTLADWFDQSVKTTASPTFNAITANGLITALAAGPIAIQIGADLGIQMGSAGDISDVGGVMVVNGAINFLGGISVAGVATVSGSFTAQSGETITVNSGMIVSIV